MFSGIVETAATVVSAVRDGGNLHLTLRCPFADELKIDQSVAHNGVCLTVVAIAGDTYTVTAIEETLRRSNLGLLQPGDRVNVERCIGCGACENLCPARPFSAIYVEGNERHRII